MGFRRNATSQRRRRVLLDDTLASAGEKGDPNNATSVEPKNSYTDDARPERQSRITDLVPIRYLTISALFVLALAIIALVQTCYWYLPQLEQYIAAEHLAAFDLQRPANLGTWFSSVWLLLGGMVSCLIYQLRKHRTDDYRGAYRLWLPTTCLFLLASIDATTRVSHATAGFIAKSTGISLFGDAVNWSIVIYALPLTYFTVRGFIEIKRSRAAVASLTGMMLAWSVGLVVLSPLAGSLDSNVSAIVGSSSNMLAHFFALATVVMYGRYVLLDAQGKIAAPVAKSKAKEERESATEEDSPSKTAHQTNSTSTEKPASQPRAKAKPPAEAEVKKTPDNSASTGDESSALNEEPTLSKAERRRLRKQQRKGKRAA